jgi:hypothetical protein
MLWNQGVAQKKQLPIAGCQLGVRRTALPFARRRREEWGTQATDLLENGKGARDGGRLGFFYSTKTD